MDANGIDLTAIPFPGSTWNDLTEYGSDIHRLQLRIYPGSLKGCFPVRTDAVIAESGFTSFSTSPDMPDQIVLEISGRNLTACHLCTHKIFHKVLVNKYVGLISLQYYQTIIAYIIDTMPIATVSNIAQ